MQFPTYLPTHPSTYPPVLRATRAGLAGNSRIPRCVLHKDDKCSIGQYVQDIRSTGAFSHLLLGHGHVDDGLGSSNVVDGRDAPVRDSEVLVDNLETARAFSNEHNQ